MSIPLRFVSFAALFAALSTAEPAQAFNGFFASKQGGQVKSYTTQVTVMKGGNATAVSVMPDYEGPLEGFALVMVVPGDVTTDRVNTLKREFIDRVDQVSAPRFHEFWEQNPCDPGPPEQDWERVLKVQGGGFLGGGSITGGSKKIAKELFLDIEAKKKEGEYAFSVLEANQGIGNWLSAKGYKVPNGADAAVKPYVDQGMKVLVAEVDPKRIELVGGDRAQLSPVRYYTEQPFDTVVAKPGLLNSPGKQELFIYILDPEARYEAKNYKTIYPPTNINVDFVVKERMGEFYSALHDIILEKNPKSFLQEYAWSAEGCGQPCATEPLMIHELLSLGGDVFEKSVPDEEKNPKPPELSKEEQDAKKAEYKELKPKERKERQKQFEDERKTIAARKGLVERHKYVLSRLHYRYDAASLPEDPKIGPAGDAIEAGIALPKGQKMEATTEVKKAEKSRFQTRYNNFHPWVPVIHCEQPERGKWGKSPPDYRGLRKVWIAEDISRKSRTQIKPAKVVLTPLPALGLGMTPQLNVADAGPDASTGAAGAETGKCGCRVPGASAPATGLLLAAAGVFLGLARRRKRQ